MHRHHEQRGGFLLKWKLLSIIGALLMSLVMVSTYMPDALAFNVYNLDEGTCQPHSSWWNAANASADSFSNGYDNCLAKVADTGYAAWTAPVDYTSSGHTYGVQTWEPSAHSGDAWGLVDYLVYDSTGSVKTTITYDQSSHSTGFWYYVGGPYRFSGTGTLDATPHGGDVFPIAAEASFWS